MKTLDWSTTPGKDVTCFAFLCYFKVWIHGGQEKGYGRAAFTNSLRDFLKEGKICTFKFCFKPLLLTNAMIHLVSCTKS